MKGTTKKYYFGIAGISFLCAALSCMLTILCYGWITGDIMRKMRGEQAVAMDEMQTIYGQQAAAADEMRKLQEEQAALAGEVSLLQEEQRTLRQEAETELGRDREIGIYWDTSYMHVNRFEELEIPYDPYWSDCSQIRCTLYNRDYLSAEGVYEYLDEDGEEVAEVIRYGYNIRIYPVGSSRDEEFVLLDMLLEVDEELANLLMQPGVLWNEDDTEADPAGQEISTVMDNLQLCCEERKFGYNDAHEAGFYMQHGRIYFIDVFGEGTVYYAKLEDIGEKLVVEAW